jgi:SAM-dependent methyltransferase
MNLDRGFTPACFLCRASNPEVSNTLKTEQIIKLWLLSGVKFSDEALGNLRRVEDVHLFHCRNCGFEFFDPNLVGNDRFYAELHAQLPGYYSPARPENERNARFAQERGFRTILDVGCGTGFALDAARERGLQTYGLEITASAADDARARGHTVFSLLLHELSAEWDGQFDLISLNQLLEHVPDPVVLVKDCVRLLSPRGVIAIAVPSSEGVLRWHPWLAANWPPHHLSRWRSKDFYSLGKRSDLVVVKTGGNQLLGSELEGNLLANREHHLVVGKHYRGPSAAVIKLLCFLYRKTGMKFLLRSQGHSIFCFLERKR